MALTMAQALTRVREQVDESSAAQWSQTELRRWIMEAAKDIARRTRCLRSSATVSSVAGQSEYTVSTRLVEVTHADYLASGWSAPRPLTYVDLHTKASFGYASAFYPQFFSMWGEPGALKVILHPAPAASSETLTLYYYRLPAEIDLAGTQDSNTVEIPEGWDDLIYLYAEACARRRDQQSDAWKDAFQLYETKLAELSAIALRYTDQAGSMVDDWSRSEWWFGPYGRGR